MFPCRLCVPGQQSGRNVNVEGRPALQFDICVLYRPAWPDTGCRGIVTRIADFSRATGLLAPQVRAARLVDRERQIASVLTNAWLCSRGTQGWTHEGPGVLEGTRRGLFGYPRKGT